MARLGAALQAHARALALAAQHIGLGAMTLECAAQMPRPLPVWPLFNDPVALVATSTQAAARGSAGAGGGGAPQGDAAAQAGGAGPLGGSGGGGGGVLQNLVQLAGGAAAAAAAGQDREDGAGAGEGAEPMSSSVDATWRDVIRWSKRDHVAVRFSEATSAANAARRVGLSKGLGSRVRV
jgi:hypothetical protein